MPKQEFGIIATPIALLGLMPYDGAMRNLQLNSDTKRYLIPRKTILAGQYFFYFGVMGVFLPYFNLYCDYLGFSGTQIGNLSAARQVAMIIFPLIWGVLADRYNARRPIFIFCSFLSAAVWAGLLITHNFWWMFLIVTIYGIFYAPLIPFLEAFAMDVLKGRKKTYGRMRLWGSIAFITMVLGLGWFIERFSIEIIIGVVLGGSILQAVIALGIPSTGPVNTVPFGQGVRHIFHPRFVVFMIWAFLMLLSHGAYYGFFSIHLKNLGFGTGFISGCWTLQSMSEISVMMFSGRIFKKFSLKNVLIFSFLIAVVRWGALFLFNGAGAILASQLTHAVTYGAFHMASILYVDRLIPKEVKTLGQGINNALTYGLGLMVGFYISGILYEVFGTAPLFGVSAAIALLGGVIFAGSESLQKRLRQKQGLNPPGGEKKERAAI